MLLSPQQSGAIALQGGMIRHEHNVLSNQMAWMRIFWKEASEPEGHSVPYVQSWHTTTNKEDHFQRHLGTVLLEHTLMK